MANWGLGEDVDVVAVAGADARAEVGGVEADGEELSTAVADAFAPKSLMSCSRPSTAFALAAALVVAVVEEAGAWMLASCPVWRVVSEARFPADELNEDWATAPPGIPELTAVSADDRLEEEAPTVVRVGGIVVAADELEVNVALTLPKIEVKPDGPGPIPMAEKRTFPMNVMMASSGMFAMSLLDGIRSAIRFVSRCCGASVAVAELDDAIDVMLDGVFVEVLDSFVAVS